MTKFESREAVALKLVWEGWDYLSEIAPDDMPDEPLTEALRSWQRANDLLESLLPEVEGW